MAGSVGRRPAPPAPARAGYRWEIVADPDWRMLGPGHSKRCRNWGAHRGGGPLAVAELRRERWNPGSGGRPVPVWWAYCADHLYGRWIEAGAVQSYRLRPIP